jgi:hypothetical protein
MKIINKIAFLVHEPTMYAHYSSVWAEMDRGSFSVVFLDDFEARLREGSVAEKSVVEKIDAQGYEYRFFSDLLRAGVKYRYVLSNHKIGGHSLYSMSDSGIDPHLVLMKLKTRLKTVIKTIINAAYQIQGKEKKFSSRIRDPLQYIPLQVGIKQIRFMYGADISDGWSLQKWNEMYDLFLCHGPNDESELGKKFSGKTALMGYPRYDGYFSPDLCVDGVVKEFDLDKSKKTILWMPTIDMFGDGVCSIHYFAEAIAMLMEEYNVIVRPHPLSFRLDVDGINLLKSLSYKIDSDASRDMNYLYRVADVVLCDHGGSAFGALYLGKKLIFLETPNSGSSAVGESSSNSQLMHFFPVIDVGEARNLDALLKDNVFWQKCEEETKHISERFFADFRGNSSKKAAEILGNLDTILN